MGNSVEAVFLFWLVELVQQVSNDYDVFVRDQMLAHLRLCNELVMFKTDVEFVADWVLC